MVRGARHAQLERARLPTVTVVIAFVIVTVPAATASIALISPPSAVLVIAPPSVLQGAVASRDCGTPRVGMQVSQPTCVCAAIRTNVRAVPRSVFRRMSEPTPGAWPQSLLVTTSSSSANCSRAAARRVGTCSLGMPSGGGS